ncbi:MAG: GspE/PulE family protein [Candidatus Veblenbacteria bacterium]|nr:GspE/PulE family protein [Candidatus Veblenbacteria bacterium]MDZ4230106.1 GspE/PulE family protein [Candidatus Veblenbacteria bacterium]
MMNFSLIHSQPKPVQVEVELSAEPVNVISKHAKAESLVLQCRERLEKELARGGEVSIIHLVDSLVECAYLMRASDIHLDPEGVNVRVRFRIDGVLQDMYALPKVIHPEIISRIKILANLRTDEHQAAQDGRFHSTLEGDQSVDVRVSVVPTYYGEDVVLRLLTDQDSEFSLESLGFSQENQTKILAAIDKPYGMILATGPTGSGKTTTLYTILKMLNTKDVSIITIEDPIEYSLPGINQIQVNQRTNLSFANGLRSILRQDPNIIMVGEIRDGETAGLAVNTALTGHLLLSTLHTNDAATTLPRLLDMKVEPYLIASTVNVAIAQRLARRICAECRVSKEPTAAEQKRLSEIVSPQLVEACKAFYRGAGCEACNHTGYQGRVGIHEVMVVDGVLREAVLQKATSSELKRVALQQGMISMVEDGFQKAAKGITTIEEVLRMLYE